MRSGPKRCQTVHESAEKDGALSKGAEKPCRGKSVCVGGRRTDIRTVTHPRVFGGVRVLEQRPHEGPPPFPSRHPAAVLLHAQPLQVAVAAGERRVVLRLVRLGGLEAVQGFLGVAMLPVVHPAARLHVRLVDAPEGELILEERPAHIVGAVELAGAVVVEDEGEGGRVAVEKELVGFGVVVEVAVGVGLGQPGQAGARQRLQGIPVGLVSDPAAVDHDLLAI